MLQSHHSPPHWPVASRPSEVGQFRHAFVSSASVAVSPVCFYCIRGSGLSTCADSGLGAALGGSEVHVFDETLITYAVRSPVARKTALAPPRERESSRRYLEGGLSTLHSQQCVAKCQQGTQHAVHGIHNHALPLAPRTPPPLVAVRTAAAALPKPAGRSRRGPATRSRRARQLSCVREHTAPTPVISVDVWAGTVVRVGWHTHLQCADGLHSRHQRLLRLELEYTRPSARQCNPGEGECAAVACCGTCHFSPGSSFRSGPGLFCSACHALQNNRDAHAQLGRTRPCEVPQLVCEKKRGFFSEPGHVKLRLLVCRRLQASAVSAENDFS